LRSDSCCIASSLVGDYNVRPNDVAVFGHRRDSCLRRLGEDPRRWRSRYPPEGGVGSEADVAVAWLDQPALIGERDSLGAVVEPEFGEDAGDV
jgi:hypothetical protein